MIVKFREVGNSVAVTIPKDIVRKFGIFSGKEADVFVNNDTIVVKPVNAKITLKSLFADYKGDYKPTEIDWGQKKGNEI